MEEFEVSERKEGIVKRFFQTMVEWIQNIKKNNGKLILTEVKMTFKWVKKKFAEKLV